MRKADRYPRNDKMDYGHIYFYTAAIHQGYHLLKADRYKDVIIESFQFLYEKRKLDIYAFVIMPNHLHAIWSPVEPNGNESPQSSFLKYTAHRFQKMIREDKRFEEETFRVFASNKKYEFWEKDSLAVPINNGETALQKLNYIHNNPLTEHWNLARNPCDYLYSSAGFYFLQKNNFPFLNNLLEIFP